MNHKMPRQITQVDQVDDTEVDQVDDQVDDTEVDQVDDTEVDQVDTEVDNDNTLSKVNKSEDELVKEDELVHVENDNDSN